MNDTIFKNKRICGVYPLGQVLIGGHVPPGPLAGPKGIVSQEEFWDGDSFANLTDPKIRCFWNHDESLQLGSIGAGSLRLWIGGGNLNFELSLEEDNEIAKYVFETRMGEHDFVGLSPGYRSEASGKRPINGVPHIRVHLREFSLTPRPMHRASRAWLESDMDDRALDKHLIDCRKWLDETSKAYDSGLADRIEGAKAYLAESKKLKTGLENTATEGWSREKINEFKRNHPRFIAAEARGHEQATLR